MTENKETQLDKDNIKHSSDIETSTEVATKSGPTIAEREHEKVKEPQHDRNRKFTQHLLELLPHGNSKTVEKKQFLTRNTDLLQPPKPFIPNLDDVNVTRGVYKSASNSFQSEIILLDAGNFDESPERLVNKDEFGTQRVYKKTSPNCVLTLYLPTREITLTGNSPAILRGIVFVDPKAIQGYRVYAQLTLTFRYGREDEEVMGLRFCNEAIMSLHQIWPRNEETSMENLSPLQEALVKRLGDGAHPFTLTLTSQAPPSVQLVPAKRYYGAPIGTSYDVRCFIADKTDEKFHRRASVKMGIRVIYRADVFHHTNGPENFTALINNQTASPPISATTIKDSTPPTQIETNSISTSTQHPNETIPKADSSSSTNNSRFGGALALTNVSSAPAGTTTPSTLQTAAGQSKLARKSDRGDTFPKLRLSPKSFRFSGRFGRSKSEIEKCPNDPFYNYSKSFQEYDSIGGGPQGAVDKPFLLQDGRVSLRASLDKAWYTHGEDVSVTVNIRNDSRKTVRKVRVCAIQHVDVCMFNNGKFKNVVADSDILSPVDRTVQPGGTLNTTITLKPQRGPTKNWIALEDTLQRSTEPDEITGLIAASAIRSPNLALPLLGPQNACSSPAVGIPTFPHTSHNSSHGPHTNDDRNVFAIYVSYYVKVKLTLSGMGGELSLKLPFVLVHVDETQRSAATQATLGDMNMEKLALHDVPTLKKNGNKVRTPTTETNNAKDDKVESENEKIDKIDTLDDECDIRVPVPTTITISRSNSNKRRLMRSETLAKDIDEESAEQLRENQIETEVTVHQQKLSMDEEASEGGSGLHEVQIHVQSSDYSLAANASTTNNCLAQKLGEQDDPNFIQSVPMTNTIEAANENNTMQTTQVDDEASGVEKEDAAGSNV